MTNRAEEIDVLTRLIAALEIGHDHMIDAAADAMIDGEWATATNLTETARMIARQLRFRQDELADMDDEDTYA